MLPGRPQNRKAQFMELSSYLACFEASDGADLKLLSRSHLLTWIPVLECFRTQLKKPFKQVPISVRLVHFRS